MLNVLAIMNELERNEAFGLAQRGDDKIAMRRRRITDGLDPETGRSHHDDEKYVVKPVVIKQGHDLEQAFGKDLEEKEFFLEMLEWNSMSFDTEAPFYSDSHSFSPTLRPSSHTTRPFLVPTVSTESSSMEPTDGIRSNPTPTRVPPMTPDPPRSSTSHPSDVVTLSPSHVSSTDPSDVISLSPSHVSTADHRSDGAHSRSHFSTAHPSDVITRSPSHVSTAHPSDGVTRSPSHVSSAHPSYLVTRSPSHISTAHPIDGDTLSPSHVSSAHPSYSVTRSPSHISCAHPIDVVTLSPSHVSSAHPSDGVTFSPSHVPSADPSDGVTFSPSHAPTTIRMAFQCTEKGMILTKFPLSSVTTISVKVGYVAESIFYTSDYWMDVQDKIVETCIVAALNCRHDSILNETRGFSIKTLFMAEECRPKISICTSLETRLEFAIAEKVDPNVTAFSCYLALETGMTDGSMARSIPGIDRLEYKTPFLPKTDNLLSSTGPKSSISPFTMATVLVMSLVGLVTMFLWERHHRRLNRGHVQLVENVGLMGT